MKISMIEIVSSHGGMNYYDYGLLKALGKLGYEVTLYTSSPLLFDISNENNISVDLVYKNLFAQKNKISKLMKFVFGTLNAVHKSKKKNVKVIHFQVFAITVLECFIIWLCKKNKLKTIVTVHDVESFNRENKTKLIKYFYKNIDEIIIHNKVSYDTLRNYLESSTLLKEKINHCHIIPHGSYIGMLPKKIEKSVAKNHFDLSEDTFTILFFGQIKKVKGLDILLNAIPKVIDNCSKKIKIIIAGKMWKDEVGIYNEIINKNNLKDYLIMDIKYIKDEEIVYYYSVADCIVLPYKKIFQSGVLLMAQSYKVPVIVSDLQGMTEIVEDGVNGFVFKSESIEELAKCIIKVVNSNSLDRVVSSAYSKLQNEYSWDSIAKKQVQVMESM